MQSTHIDVLLAAPNRPRLPATREVIIHQRAEVLISFPTCDPELMQGGKLRGRKLERSPHPFGSRERGLYLYFLDLPLVVGNHGIEQLGTLHGKTEKGKCFGRQK